MQRSLLTGHLIKFLIKWKDSVKEAWKETKEQVKEGADKAKKEIKEGYNNAKKEVKKTLD